MLLKKVIKRRVVVDAPVVKKYLIISNPKKYVILWSFQDDKIKL